MSEREEMVRTAMAVLSEHKEAAGWKVVDPFVPSDDASMAVREPGGGGGGLELLTERELEVVAALATGRSTKEVAFALGIADATVRVLVARARTKLGAPSRKELLEHPAVRGLPTDRQ